MRRHPEDAWDPGPWDRSPFSDPPREEWDERDWERHLDRQDVLEAKYQEIFETVGDQANWTQLIAAEMHWNLPEGYGGEAGQPGVGDGPCDDGDRSCLRAAEELRHIPAYRLAESLAFAIGQELSRRVADPEDDPDAVHALDTASEVADHVADGHRIGYRRGQLCGNIVCCRRALASLSECFDGLLALRERGVVRPAEAERLLAAGQRVREAITRRAGELRGEVWRR